MYIGIFKTKFGFLNIITEIEIGYIGFGYSGAGSEIMLGPSIYLISAHERKKRS